MLALSVGGAEAGQAQEEDRTGWIVLGTDPQVSEAVSEKAERLILPKKTRDVRLDMPSSTRRARRMVTIVVDALIRKDGSVVPLYVGPSSDKKFRDECLRRTSKWRYRPGVLDGKVVPVRMILTCMARFG